MPRHRFIKPSYPASHKVAIPYHTDRARSLQEFAKILEREVPDVKVKIIERFKFYQYPE